MLRINGARWILSAAMPLLIGSAALAAPAVADTGTGALGPRIGGMKPDFGRLPMAFEANQGQADSQVRYLARGPGYALYLTDEAAVLDLPATKDATYRAVRMRLVGAQIGAVAGKGQLPGKSNYFIGNDPKRWHSNVPTYERVEYASVYPGIDLAYYGNQAGKLEYDFIVAPGSDPHAIQFAIASDFTPGAPRPHLRIAANGDLVVPTSSGEIRLHKPVVYQADQARPRGSVSAKAGLRTVRNGRFVLTARDQVRFAIGHYDHARALIIDPVLSYSTYLGGSDSGIEDSPESGYAIAVDSSGNAYITGLTGASDFPTLSGFQDVSRDSQNGTAFVTKINATGTALIYSTYLGGSGQEQGNGIAVDAAGNAYVTGTTESLDFPTKNPFQDSIDIAVSAFVTKLNAAGSALVYSTYLSGNSASYGNGIAVDSGGSAYVTGVATGSGFPTLNAYQADANQGGAFVTKFAPSGSVLIYSTYLHGSVGESANGIAVDSAGDAYVTGYTFSPDFPTVNAFQSTIHVPANTYTAFVTKFNAAGSALIYSTFLGGTTNSSSGAAIAVDPAGSAYVAGVTQATDFPTTPNAFQSMSDGVGVAHQAAFVTKFDPSGATLTYSSYLGTGGSGGAAATGIAVNALGEAFVTGSASGASFPSVNSVQPTDPGSTNAFLTQFNASGSALLFSTYLGGSQDQGAAGVALDASGNAYLTGYTSSTDFPILNALQATNRETAPDDTPGTAFVAKFGTAVAATPPSVTISASPANITVGASSTIIWSSTNATACTASGAWSGTEPTSGSVTVTPSAVGSSSYTLACTGAGGASGPSTAVLTVNPVVSVTISGKAGGGSMGHGSILGLVLLLAVRLRRLLRPKHIAASALLLASLQASAQQVQLDWAHAYVGLRAGEADYTESAGRLDADVRSAGELFTSTQISQHKAGGVLYAGVPFYQSLSLEVGFADLGTYPVQITTTSTNIAQLAQTTANKLWSAGRGFTAGLAAPIDLGSWFAIEPRLGLLAYQSTQKAYTADGTFSQDRKGLGADAGIAALLRPRHWLSLGAGIDCFETGGRCSVLLYSVEIEYRFGR